VDAATGAGPAPAEANDPIMLMLYGLTTDRIQSWLGATDANANELRGVAASAGQATGTGAGRALGQRLVGC